MENLENIIPVTNVFISVVDERNLKFIINALPKNTNFYTTNEGRRKVMECLGFNDLNRILGLDQYNFDPRNDSFQSFGKNIFIGMLFKDNHDKTVLKAERIPPIDLAIINFGEKRIIDLSRDELAALAFSSVGVSNFQHLAILSDPDDYIGFIEKKRGTKAKERFDLAQKTAQMLSKLFTDSFVYEKKVI